MRRSAAVVRPEQSALLLLDAVILDITTADPQAYAAMQARHANLQ